jgi:hypothetical protein
MSEGNARVLEELLMELALREYKMDGFCGLELNIPPSEPHSGAVWAAALRNRLIFKKLDLHRRKNVAKLRDFSGR